MEQTKQPLSARLADQVYATLSFFTKEIEEIRLLSDKVEAQMEAVVNLAKQVYEEGHDFWGEDYVSQSLSWDEKRILQEILDDNLPFERLQGELKKLLAHLQDMEWFLRNELTCLKLSPKNN